MYGDDVYSFGVWVFLLFLLLTPPPFLPCFLAFAVMDANLPSYADW